MRFLSSDPKWSRRAPLKSPLRTLAQGPVVHHNTLNAFVAVPQDEAARSHEIERFFDVMTVATPPVPGKRP